MELNCDEIRQLLPHRYPFLLLDKVTAVVPGSEAAGIKNVTVNESFFQGHFPGRSIMPGVMIVEALAQLTAIAYCSKVLLEKDVPDFKSLETTPEEIAERVGYLVEINVKIKKTVVPGDQLILRAILGKSLGQLTKVKVSARVGNVMVLEGYLTVSERT